MATQDSRLEDDKFFSNMFLACDEHGVINDSDCSDSDFNMDQPIFNDAEDIEIDEDNTGPTIQIHATQTLHEALTQAGKDVAEPIQQTLILWMQRGLILLFFLMDLAGAAKHVYKTPKYSLHNHL